MGDGDSFSHAGACLFFPFNDRLDDGFRVDVAELAGAVERGNKFSDDIIAPV
jgi:hypothetical protein